MILLLNRFLPLLMLFPKIRFQKTSLKYFNQRKIFSRKLTSTQNDFNTSKPLLTCSELFYSILHNQIPVYKNELQDFLIINKPSEIMRHKIFNVNITEYVSKVLSSNQDADARLKQLFAVVTGMGRGKTRMLVEMQKEFNKNPKVFCLALKFNRHI